MEDRMTGCTKYVKSATATRNLEKPLGRDELGKRCPHRGLNLAERRAHLGDRMNGCTKHVKSATTIRNLEEPLNTDERGTRCPHGGLNFAEKGGRTWKTG
jgi:hypothetical protein